MPTNNSVTSGTRLTKKTGTPASYYLGLIPVILLAFAAMIGSYWSNSPAGIALRMKEQETKQMEVKLEMMKVETRETPSSPVYLTENISEVRNVDYARPTRQNCDSSPPIGWEKWFADGRLSVTDEHSSKCMDITLPVAGRYEIPFHLFRKPEAVNGKFTVTANDGKCDTEESNDKCLSFVREHLQQKLIFEGKRIFIQPAPMDRRM